MCAVLLLDTFTTTSAPCARVSLCTPVFSGTHLRMVRHHRAVPFAHTLLRRLPSPPHLRTRTRAPPLPWAECAGGVSPAVLKLLKMATGMRALLDTVVQALPQVRVPPPGGPPGWCRCLTGPDFPSPAGPEPGAVIEGKGPLCLFLPDQGLTVPALFLALSWALRTHMRPSGVSRLPQGRVGKGGGVLTLLGEIREDIRGL